MFIYKFKRIKRVPTFWILLLSILFTTTLAIPTAGAHGTSSGSESGGLALLIFPVAAVLFALFLVFMHRKKGWTVLVTGGAGYIGSALVPNLLQHGHRVIVLDRSPHSYKILEKYKDYENFRQINGDVTDPSTLETALQGCDAIIHLACVTGHTESEISSQNRKTTNLLAFEPLLETAKAMGIKRFIFASSLRSKSFGDLSGTATQLPLDETDEFLLDKEKCECLLTNAGTPNFIVCTIRTAFVYGIAPSQRVDCGVNAYAWKGFKEGEIKIIGDEKQKIPNIHVQDLAKIYLDVLNQPDSKINQKVYNANLENLTRKEIATTVVATLTNEVTVHIEPKADEGPELLHNLANYEFGFEQKHTISDSMSDLIASFKD